MGELHDFAERGDLDGVQRLLDSGVAVDALWMKATKLRCTVRPCSAIPRYFGFCSSAGPPSIRPTAISSGPR